MVTRRAQAIGRILFWAFLALVSGMLVGLWQGHDSVARWLYAFSGSLEFCGLLLVAAPELSPWVKWVAELLASGWRKLQGLGRRGRDRVLRLFDRLHVHQAVSAGGAIAGGVALSGSARVSVGEATSLEQRIDYLLRRDQVVQDRLEQLQLSVNALPDRWRADIEEESRTLRNEYKQALVQQRGELLLERLVGIVMVALGVLLATWGNLA